MFNVVNPPAGFLLARAGYSAPNGWDGAISVVHGAMRLPRRMKTGFTYFNTRDRGAGVTLEIRANRLA
jgi:hypothetical protein